MQKSFQFVLGILAIAIIILAFAAPAKAQTPAQKESAQEKLADVAMPNEMLIKAPTMCAGEAGILIKEVRNFCLELAQMEKQRSIAAAKAASKAIAPDSTSFGKALLTGVAINALAPRGYYESYNSYGYGGYTPYISPNPYFRR
ncbi:MAG: hypothetical protein V4486_00135 [Patescibacteria group bacterium]